MTKLEKPMRTILASATEGKHSEVDVDRAINGVHVFQIGDVPTHWKVVKSGQVSLTFSNKSKALKHAHKIAAETNAVIYIHQQDGTVKIQPNETKGRQFYKTIITLEVLSERRIDDMEIEDIVREMTYGDMSGQVNIESVETLNGKQMAEATIAQGSDPMFFMLTNEGEDEE